MIPKEITFAIENYFQKNNQSGEILSSRSIGGGSINSAYQINTAKSQYFLKYNSAAYPNMFESEFKGLELLAGSHSIRIPKTLFYYEGKAYSCLLMEYIESGGKNAEFWKLFAEQLAKMHRSSSDFFGLSFDNYMGSLPQSNQKHTDFVEFFINERLIPQVKLARDSSFMSRQNLRQMDSLYIELGNIFPKEAPALVHGDLWSGNFMNDEMGHPVIMDPAVYYGHREVDIAMTTMFGGFSSDFYDHYNSYYPMEPGWQSRMDYYKLYPILIHVNLFGASYLYDLQRIISSFA